jgi:hypothetical protein
MIFSAVLQRCFYWEKTADGEFLTMMVLVVREENVVSIGKHQNPQQPLWATPPRMSANAEGNQTATSVSASLVAAWPSQAAQNPVDVSVRIQGSMYLEVKSHVWCLCFSPMIFPIIPYMWNVFLVDEYYIMNLGSWYHLEKLVYGVRAETNAGIIVSMQFKDPHWNSL